jgi:hypothetical protein
MENIPAVTEAAAAFNEAEWIKLLFLLSDIQAWIHEMEKDIFRQLPVTGKKRLFRKTYYISASSLAHIIERHYYKINRHPGTGKFTIPVASILYYIREAFHLPVRPHTCNTCLVRVMDTATTIGFDKNGIATTVISILTDSNGQIKTAFPGAP